MVELRGVSVTLSDDLDLKFAGTVAELANDPEIRRNIGAHSFPYPYRLSDAENFLSTNRSYGSEIFMEDFLVFSGGFLVGVVGLSDINTIDRSAHVGYWIGKKYRNKGYATDALNTICDYAFNVRKLVRIHTKVIEYNLASLRVLLKGGFTVEGFERSSFLYEGTYHSMFSLAKVRSLREY